MGVSMAQRFDALAVDVLARAAVRYREALLFAVQRLDEYVVERVLVVSGTVDLAHHSALHLPCDCIAAEDVRRGVRAHGRPEHVGKSVQQSGHAFCYRAKACGWSAARTPSRLRQHTSTVLTIMIGAHHRCGRRYHC